MTVALAAVFLPKKASSVELASNFQFETTGSTLDKGLASYFPRGCPHTHARPCKCGGWCPLLVVSCRNHQQRAPSPIQAVYSRRDKPAARDTRAQMNCALVGCARRATAQRVKHDRTVSYYHTTQQRSCRQSIAIT